MNSNTAPLGPAHDEEPSMSSSFVRVAKKLSTTALMLLCLSSQRGVWHVDARRAEQFEDFASDVPFDAAQYLELRATLGHAPCCVRLGFRMHPPSHERDHPECAIGVARRDATECREGALVSKPVGIVAGGYEECRRHLRANARPREECRSDLLDQPLQVRVECADLGVQLGPPRSESAQNESGHVSEITRGGSDTLHTGHPLLP